MYPCGALLYRAVILVKSYDVNVCVWRPKVCSYVVEGLLLSVRYRHCVSVSQRRELWIPSITLSWLYASRSLVVGFLSCTVHVSDH
jgi:hypothetical protein